MDCEDGKEIDRAICDLELKGISPYNYDEVVGLGDLVESTLKSMGITEERFKSWFNLKECNCSKRKEWLNKILSWGEVKDE